MMFAGEPDPLSVISRISYQEGSTLCILDHKFFSKIDISALESKSLKPSHIPEAKTPSAKSFDVSVNFKAYTGNHSIFDEF
jgi:hypothetical protein